MIHDRELGQTPALNLCPAHHLTSPRHPEPESRPSFSDVTTFLSQPESALLMWSEEDRAVYPNATTLGVELREGHTLYIDLQNTYIPE